MALYTLGARGSHGYVGVCGSELLPQYVCFWVTQSQWDLYPHTMWQRQCRMGKCLAWSLTGACPGLESKWFKQLWTFSNGLEPLLFLAKKLSRTPLSIFSLYSGHTNQVLDAARLGKEIWDTNISALGLMGKSGEGCILGWDEWEEPHLGMKNSGFSARSVSEGVGNSAMLVTIEKKLAMLLFKPLVCTCSSYLN